MELMLAYYDLRPGVAPQDYGAWARRAEQDLPAIVPGIERWGLFAAVSHGPTPQLQADVLETTDLVSWLAWKVANDVDPRMQALLVEHRELVDDASTRQLFAARVAGAGLGRAVDAPAPGAPGHVPRNAGVALLDLGAPVGDDRLAEVQASLTADALELGAESARISVYRWRGAPDGELSSWALEHDVIVGCDVDAGDRDALATLLPAAAETLGALRAAFLGGPEV